MEKILGIDFGLKRIGLALAETESCLVEPLLVMEVKHGFPEVIGKIKALCEKEEINKIVLGLPESGLVKQVKNFGNDLAKITKLPLIYEDENLTTKEAIVKMVESGVKKKKRKEKENQISAALILQNYLNKNYV